MIIFIGCEQVYLVEMPSELAGSETVDRRWRRLAIIEHLTVVNREVNLFSASLKGRPAI